jgi:hypothetical protein
MSYKDSLSMPHSIYMRNYGKSSVSKSKEHENQNLEYIKSILPLSEHRNAKLYLDPYGNVSRDCLGNLRPDINKCMDKYTK